MSERDREIILERSLQLACQEIKVLLQWDNPMAVVDLMEHFENRVRTEAAIVNEAVKNLVW